MRVDDDRRRLAAYLTHHGPTHGNSLRAALGWDVSRFWDAVYGTDRFTITTFGWDLREADGARVVSTAA